MAYRRGGNTTTTSRNRLSDRDMMVDLINTEKHLSHLYEHAIMESTNNSIHSVFEELQHDEHENAFTLFNNMQERGWYNPVGAVQQKSRKSLSIRNDNSKSGLGSTRNRSQIQFQYT